MSHAFEAISVYYTDPERKRIADLASRLLLSLSGYLQIAALLNTAIAVADRDFLIHEAVLHSRPANKGLLKENVKATTVYVTARTKKVLSKAALARIRSLSNFIRRSSEEIPFETVAKAVETARKRHFDGEAA